MSGALSSKFQPLYFKRNERLSKQFGISELDTILLLDHLETLNLQKGLKKQSY